MDTRQNVDFQVQTCKFVNFQVYMVTCEESLHSKTEVIIKLTPQKLSLNVAA